MDFISVPHPIFFNQTNIQVIGTIVLNEKINEHNYWEQ